jgi:MFS transporter, DHA2 family, multidrug resistance protein
VLFVVGIIGLFFWEWNHKTPLINLRLFRYKNFAICCFLMMLVGGVLNANTVLQPQFTQQLLGYTATTAGLALTAGGFTLVVMMPLAGIATGKYPARYLAAFGFTLLVVTFWYAAQVTNLQMSFAEASWLRVLQMLPLPFCFISITNAAYIGMPQKESNQVAGLINFVRNIGGSILISITNAQVTSRSMWHEQHLQQAMQSANIGYQQHLSALTGFFSGSAGQANSQGMALGQIYNQLIAQATTQGYQDVYMELAWSSIVLIVLAFMLGKSKPGEAAGGGGGMH